MAGRFRGEDYVYGEVEYRFPLSKCSKIVGGVVFLNASTATNRTTGVGLFEYIKPGVGLGIRVMINKRFKTNLNIDFAVGEDSQGFYFSGGEAF
jgi:outer membrane protein assembly factor BamA